MSTNGSLLQRRTQIPLHGSDLEYIGYGQIWENNEIFSHTRNNKIKEL